MLSVAKVLYQWDMVESHQGCLMDNNISFSNVNHMLRDYFVQKPAMILLRKLYPFFHTS